MVSPCIVFAQQLRPFFFLEAIQKGGRKKRKTLAFNHSKWRLFEKRQLMSAAFDNVTEAPGERLSWKFSHQGTVQAARY